VPKFLLIGTDYRLQLIDDFAAIAELSPLDIDGVRFFEAVWQGQTLHIETAIVRDQDLILSRASDADILIMVISESDGPMPMDAAELAATPDRIELSAVYLSNPQPDPEIRDLVKLEITQLVFRNRPRWQPRYLTENCSAFFHTLKAAFFTDCL
jgi:hypothetical protein